MSSLQNSIMKKFKNISEDVLSVKRVLTKPPAGRTFSTPAESCSWLNEHHYNLNSGKYWLLKGGRRSFEYCEMDEAGIPLPPAASCKELKERNPDLKSGSYNITIKGKSFGVVCDMENDGGGWMVIGSAVVKKNEEAKEVDWEKIRSDDYSQLAKVTTGRFLLSSKGLVSLFEAKPFTQIQFFCHKPYHGRQLHLKTKGTDVVDFFLQRKSKAPKSCGSYERMHGDNSFVGLNCGKWIFQTWGGNSMYHVPMIGMDDKKLWYTISLNYKKYQILCCDDDGNHLDFNSVGEWTWSVR